MTLARARDVLVDARSVAVLTGAGISTDSGIPDFRGPNGIWTRDPEAELLSTIDAYLTRPDIRRRAWQARLDNPSWSARPNAGHLALTDLDREGRLLHLATQNVDGLHLAAGTSPSRVAEVHGTIREALCVACEWRGPMVDVLARVRAGEADPPCGECGGIIKSATVYFGESLDDRLVEVSFAAAENADVMLAVGTTLQVYPIAQMVELAARARVPVVVVNGAPTALDHLASAVVIGSISEVLPGLVAPQ